MAGSRTVRVSVLFACTVITAIRVKSDEPNDTMGRSSWCTRGHYPGPFCHAINVILNHTSRTFIVPTAHSLPQEAAQTFRVWPVISTEVPRPPVCDRTFKESVLFTFFYWYGQSNYFHLHYDTLLPIFSHIREHRGHGGKHRLTLMPTVETSRLNVSDVISVTIN